MDQLRQAGVTRRIVQSIKDQISAGTYGPGDRLPSTRALAAEWGASRSTVTAAYGQLIAEGYLETRIRARPTVARALQSPAGRPRRSADPPARLSAFARRALDGASPLPLDPGPIADFRYGELLGSDFPVLAWRRSLQAATAKRAPRLRYDDPQGSPRLRAALQSYLWRARGIHCEPDQILVVNGSQQGLDLCARLLLDPGDPFVIEDPGYGLARQAFVAAGGVSVPVSVDREGMQTDGLPPARLAYVTPSHQFPLGSVLSAARRQALLAWAVRVGAYVVEDDYDGEYRYDIDPIPPVQTSRPERVIYIGTVSKTLSPTLRLGYAVAGRAPGSVHPGQGFDRPTQPPHRAGGSCRAVGEWGLRAPRPQREAKECRASRGAARSTSTVLRWIRVRDGSGGRTSPRALAV